MCSLSEQTVLPIASIHEPSGKVETKEREHSENEFQTTRRFSQQPNRRLASVRYEAHGVTNKRPLTNRNNTTLVWARQTSKRMPPALFMVCTPTHDSVGSSRPLVQIEETSKLNKLVFVLLQNTLSCVCRRAEPDGAICNRKQGTQNICNSCLLTQFTAFFIDPRAK